MFDTIIREAATRFGLGDKAGPLIHMLLAYITNKDSGGLAGFMAKLSSAGLGGMAQSWLGGGAGAQPVSAGQLETLFGGHGGLLSAITSKLGIGSSAVTSALGFILPAVIGKLTPGGTVPASLPSDVMGFIGSGAPSMAGSGAAGGAAAGGGLMKWLPWLVAGAAVLFLLSYCNKGGDTAKQAATASKAGVAAGADAAKTAADDAAKATVDAAKATADASAKATADAAKAATDAAAAVVPTGSGVVAYTANDAPALKVYFDTGKVDVASEFADKSKDMLAFLAANATAKAVVSGFNDPTGNAAANAELSKNRAKGVAAALKAAGIADDRVLLEKPADTTTGAAISNAQARRVEITVRK
jgi:uncharacterized protein YidB (DUF937 family)/outer membrane protein OmpA-like peptidoglycan-associated protein